MHIRPGMTVLVSVGAVEGPGRRRDILRRPGMVIAYDSKLGATIDVHVLGEDEEDILVTGENLAMVLCARIVRVFRSTKGDHIGQFLAMP